MVSYSLPQATDMPNEPGTATTPGRAVSLARSGNKDRAIDRSKRANEMSPARGLHTTRYLGTRSMVIQYLADMQMRRRSTNLNIPLQRPLEGVISALFYYKQAHCFLSSTVVLNFRTHVHLGR